MENKKKITNIPFTISVKNTMNKTKSVTLFDAFSKANEQSPRYGNQVGIEITTKHTPYNQLLEYIKVSEFTVGLILVVSSNDKQYKNTFNFVNSDIKTRTLQTPVNINTDSPDKQGFHHIEADFIINGFSKISFDLEPLTEIKILIYDYEN